MSDVAFHRRWLPNRSLSPAGRLMWLLLMGSGTLLIGCAFAAVGVWWVLPFAGIEIVLLVYAFNRISAGDSDFECLDMRDGCWSYQSKRRGELITVGGAISWLRVEEHKIGGRLVVGLRYAGRQYEVGSFLPEDQRAGLARELVGVIRGAA